MRSKKDTWQELKSEWMKDPKFKKDWDEAEPYRQVAHEIMRIRIEANLTQAQLAEKIGTSRTAISRLESADYGRISFNTLVRIGQALGMIPELRFRKAS